MHRVYVNIRDKYYRDTLNSKATYVTPFENAQRWMGKNLFHFLLLNDDDIEMPNMCPFEKKEKEDFFRLPTFFSGTKKFFPRNNFCSVFYVL